MTTKTKTSGKRCESCKNEIATGWLAVRATVRARRFFAKDDRTLHAPGEPGKTGCGRPIGREVDDYEIDEGRFVGGCASGGCGKVD